MDVNISNSTFTSIENPYSVLETVFILVITSILNLVTIIGNMLFIISFHTNEKLKTLDNYFLLNIAVSDFIIGTISMPIYTSYIFLEKWALNPLGCYSWTCLDYFCKNASIVIMLVMVYEQYLAKMYSIEYLSKLIRRQTANTFAFSWIYSSLYFPGSILFLSLIRLPPPPENGCYLDLIENNLIKTIFAVITFYLPVLSMCYCYYKPWINAEQNPKKETQVFTKKQVEKVSSSHPYNPVLESRDLSSNLATTPIEPSHKLSPHLMSSEENDKTCYHKFKDFLSLLCNIYYDDGDEDHINFDETICSSEETPQFPKNSADIVKQKQIAQKKILRNESHDNVNPMIKENGMNTIMMNGNGMTEGIPTDTMISLKTTNVRAKKSKTGRNITTRVSKDAVKMLHAICLTFILTHLPQNVLTVIKTVSDLFDYKVYIPNLLFSLYFYLCYMNSLLHPICYAMVNSDIRKAYWKILTCIWKQKYVPKIDIVRKNLSI